MKYLETAHPTRHLFDSQDIEYIVLTTSPISEGLTPPFSSLIRQSVAIETGLPNYNFWRFICASWPAVSMRASAEKRARKAAGNNHTVKKGMVLKGL